VAATAWERAHQVPLPVEALLAGLVNLATFALVGAAFSAIGSHLVAALLGFAYLAGVVTTARLVSVAYAVPLAMVGLLAYDWFYLPPTHPYGFPDSANLVELIMYIGVAVLVGELAGDALRRAERSERAHRIIAGEQAALRRIATLVAKEASADDIFAAVVQEAGRVLGVENATMLRYEDERTATVVATWGKDVEHVRLPPGTRRILGGSNITTLVRRTGRPARIDDYSRATGPIADDVRELGVVSAVGCPVVAEGRLWGVVVVSQGGTPLPAGTESRVTKFTELIATAISNIQARADLAASRARVVVAAHNERRRVVRDLHDGAQQRLVHTIVTLRLAERALANGGDGGSALVREAIAEAELATAELRELAHGILPAVLTRGGLPAGVEALASRAPVPVDVHVTVDRLPEAVEATAYFVIAEALTNVAKHASAAGAEVRASVEDDTLRVEVRDDGIGGAKADGSGLAGLAARLATHDGRLRVESPPGGGTLLAALIPLDISPGCRAGMPTPRARDDAPSASGPAPACGRCS
jgi:signal transduction histidine kinase